jgi:hypothetical protein
MEEIEKLKEKIGYLKFWEDVFSLVLSMNTIYKFVRSYSGQETEVEEKVREITFEYISKISDLRKSYEKKLEEVKSKTF